MPGGKPSSFRADVPARHGMVFVAAYPPDPVAVDRDDDAARGGTDPAVRELVAGHDRTLRRSSCTCWKKPPGTPVTRTSCASSWTVRRAAEEGQPRRSLPRSA